MLARHWIAKGLYTHGQLVGEESSMQIKLSENIYPDNKVISYWYHNW